MRLKSLEICQEHRGKTLMFVGRFKHVCWKIQVGFLFFVFSDFVQPVFYEKPSTGNADAARSHK